MKYHLVRNFFELRRFLSEEVSRGWAEATPEDVASKMSLPVEEFSFPYVVHITTESTKSEDTDDDQPYIKQKAESLTLDYFNDLIRETEEFLKMLKSVLKKTSDRRKKDVKDDKL
jgi:hypothetical protein